MLHACVSGLREHFLHLTASHASRRQCDYRRSRGAAVPLALYLVRHSSSNHGGTASQQCPFLHKVQDPHKARGQNSSLQSGAPGARSLHRGWLSKRGWLSNLSGTTTSGDPEIHLLSHHHFSGPGFGQPPLLRTTPPPHGYTIAGSHWIFAKKVGTSTTCPPF